MAGETPIVVALVQSHAQSDLTQIAQTGDGFGFEFGASQGGQQQPGKNDDDRNDHQQFHEGECRPCAAGDIAA
jgi:hypothetical protein